MPHDQNNSPVGWYFASYLLRFVETKDRNREDPDKRFLSWENTVLVKAKTLDEAYLKAAAIAHGQTKPYRGGASGLPVKWEFMGITQLLPVYEKLGDGAEIAWTEHNPRKLATLQRWVKPKSAFRQ